MIEYEDTIISSDIFTEQFVCNLTKCKGACCIEGDSGAPVIHEEIPQIEDVLDQVLPYLPPEGIKAIEEQSSVVIDQFGELTTPLVNNKQCAYVTYSDTGALSCGIERAFLEDKIGFRKPQSCALCPIRLSKLNSGKIALNYHQWDICSEACSLGEELKVSVFEFLKEPLTRAFGEEWYSSVDEIRKELF